MAEQPGFEEAALQRIGQQIDPMSDAMAGIMGMPPGGKRYTQQEIDDEWNYSPIADPRQRVEMMLQLKQMGQTDEQITDQVYPNRRRVITSGRSQTAEQIRFAKQQDARMTKLAAAATALPGPGLPDAAIPATAPDTQPGPVAQPAPLPPVTTSSVPTTDAPAPSGPSILDRPITSMVGG